VNLEYYAVAAIVALGAFVQGTIGVGFALIAVPVIAFLDRELLPACVLALMIPLNIYVIWRERTAVDWSGAGWITLGRILGTAGGLALLALLLPADLSVATGAVTIAAALVTLLAPYFEPDRNSLFAAGLITGVTETATGIGGPPLALVYQHQAGPILRSTLATCFLIGQVFSLLALMAVGRVNAAQLATAAMLLPALVIGLFASKHVHKGLEGPWLRRFVLLFAVVSGLGLLVLR
jgi:uncharacterized membrane protein YfcA